MDNYEQVILWAVGALGAPLIQWIKERFSISGKPALFLALVVSVILAAGAMFANGDLGVDSFEPGNLLAAFGQISAAAMVAYNLLIKK